jgi:2-dehydropantoate 2-reductase
VPATTPEQVKETYETVLLAVKAQDTEGASLALAPHLAPAGVVISAQNGLNERVIAGIVGAERTIGCFVNFGADYHEPGVVMHGGRGAVVVGELNGRRSARIGRIHELLRDFEPEAVLTANIWGYLWSKLIYGALQFRPPHGTVGRQLPSRRARPRSTFGSRFSRCARRPVCRSS